MRIGAMLAIAAAICLTTWAVSADEQADLAARIRALETKAAVLLEAGQNEAALDVVIKAQKLRDRADALRRAEAQHRARRATDRAEKQPAPRQPMPKQPRMESPGDKSPAAMAEKHLRQANEALENQRTGPALNHGRFAIALLERWARQLQARENRLKRAQQQAVPISAGAAENRLMERLERLEAQVKELREALKRQAGRPPRKPTGPQ